MKVGAAAKARSKSEVFGTIAQQVGIHRRDVAAVLHVMGSTIKADLSKNGPSVFKMPGLMLDPFAKEPMAFKAKPARNAIRVRSSEPTTPHP